MGKINFSLLNCSAVNASRLNMTGAAGKPGGGAGGYWPDGTPAAIRKSAVLWYDIAKQGATNETMADNPVLKDLSGHGHDATCYNFGWTEESGISTANYPGALVSDGVDDYCVAEGLPILTPERGYTLITKRDNRSTGSLVSNRVIDGSSGAFVFELNVNRTDSFGTSNLIPRTTSLISYQTKSMYNGVEISYGTANGVDKLLLFRLNPVDMNYMNSSAFYSLLLFDRDLTAEEIEWVKANIMDEAEPEPTPELDASLVDAWIFSGYKNEDAPASVSGEKGHALMLRNFALTGESGFADGCLVTDGMDDYARCADLPIKEDYTLITRFCAARADYFFNATSTTTYFVNGTRTNGIYPIFRDGSRYRGGFIGLWKWRDAPTAELETVWMTKDSYNGEAYDWDAAVVKPQEGQTCTVYVGCSDDRGFYCGCKTAYYALYDKVMTLEEAEAEIAKLDAMWEARKV